jgi:hypothetical protein
VRGWRLRCSDGGGGSSGHRQGPAAPKVKEEVRGMAKWQEDDRGWCSSGRGFDGGALARFR